MLNKVKVWGDALRFAWGQTSYRIWLVVCTLGIIVGLLLGIGTIQLVILVSVACIGLGAEVTNTSMETLLDIVHPKYSVRVKVVKDAFASAPKFVFSAYVISWLILVAPLLVRWMIG